MDSKGKFELMKFRNDTCSMCKRVLTADDVKEMGKIKILQITDSVSMIGHGYLWCKRSENEWYQLVPGIPCFQYGVCSDSLSPTSNHKSRG